MPSGAPGRGDAWSCIVWRVPVRPVRSTSIDPRCPEMTRSMKTETLGRSSSGSSVQEGGAKHLVEPLGVEDRQAGLVDGQKGAVLGQSHQGDRLRFEYCSKVRFCRVVSFHD